MMTMERERTAVWYGATKFSAGHSLGVSEIRSSSTLSLIASSLGGRSFQFTLNEVKGPDITLACPSGVSTPEARLSPDRQPAFRRASNLVLSNREHRLLEHLLTHRKQTTASRSNRELSTNRCCGISPSTPARKRAFPLTTFSKCVLFALLIFAVVAAASPLAAQEKRKIIID